jgi:transcriptional regulator with XRE-family HTH domain
MIDAATCRAARGLLNWSQQQLADEARIGLSTVKKFESGRSTPMVNNLAAICDTFEHAGVVLVSEKEGGPGVLLSRLRLRAFIPGEGLHFEISHKDLQLEEPDNDFDLWFRIDESTLAALAGRGIIDEADAKGIARKNEARLIATVKKWLNSRGLSSIGGRPRVILAKDLC